MTVKHISVPIDADLYEKLFDLATYEGRSANGEVVQLIQDAIEEFEKQYGPIQLDD